MSHFTDEQLVDMAAYGPSGTTSEARALLEDLRAARAQIKRLTADPIPPRVGDKVLYVAPGHPDVTSPAWARRAIPGRESVVVREPNGEDQHYGLIRWKHEDEPSMGGDDLYFAPAHRLRVVERAVYQPVQP